MDYYIKDKLLYNFGNLCIPQTERVNIIREAHTSLISGHFGVSKTFASYKGSVIGQECMKEFLDILKGVLCVLKESQVIEN